MVKANKLKESDDKKWTSRDSCFAADCSTCKKYPNDDDPLGHVCRCGFAAQWTCDNCHAFACDTCIIEKGKGRIDFICVNCNNLFK